MEGVVYSLKDCLEIIKEMGVGAVEIRASGGGGKSKLWRQMQADVFDADITTLSSGEGPALGVALLAGVGTGIYSNVQEACDEAIRVVSRQKADPRLHKAYSEYYTIYRQLYGSLKQDFKELTRKMECTASILA